MMCLTRWVFLSVRRAQNALFCRCACCTAAWRWRDWKNRARKRKKSRMRLQDQVAIITGVSYAGQVGFALASAFGREGAKLAISSRSSERVRARADELRA